MVSLSNHELCRRATSSGRAVFMSVALALIGGLGTAGQQPPREQRLLYSSSTSPTAIASSGAFRSGPPTAATTQKPSAVRRPTLRAPACTSARRDGSRQSTSPPTRSRGSDATRAVAANGWLSLPTGRRSMRRRSAVPSGMSFRPQAARCARRSASPGGRAARSTRATGLMPIWARGSRGSSR